MEDSLETKFQSLVAEWKGDTRYEPSLVQMILHPAYQQIVGLGPKVLPLLFRELQDDPDHWFWALQAITGEDVGRRATTVGDATERWLKWGRKHGYL